jgi:hypothetical protein
VNHDEELIFELPYDSLAEAPQADYPPADNGVERRVDRAQEKWAGETYGGEALSDDSRLERVEVEFDVWEFGHWSELV